MPCVQSGELVVSLVLADDTHNAVILAAHRVRTAGVPADANARDGRAVNPEDCGRVRRDDPEEGREERARGRARLVRVESEPRVEVHVTRLGHVPSRWTGSTGGCPRSKANRSLGGQRPRGGRWRGQRGCGRALQKICGLVVLVSSACRAGKLCGRLTIASAGFMCRAAGRYSRADETAPPVPMHIRICSYVCRIETVEPFAQVRGQREFCKSYRLV